MPKVFVHGNPETPFVWMPLLEELARLGVDDIVLLSPPGFGAPIPTGFGCTAGEYRDWLIEQLVGVEGSIDLVGHDWGAGHVYAVAASRPDLLSSWVADCSGLIHPDYAWHPFARTVQEPLEGEKLVAAMPSLTGDDFVANEGMPVGLAPVVAEHCNHEMAQANLSLYRSARQPYMRALGDSLAVARPVRSLIVDATADRYTSPELTADVAARTGSEVLRLEDSGHWWMWERPAEAAERMQRFWRSAEVG